MEISSHSPPSGTWYHVFNRGVAQRQIFDGEPDRRTFLSLLAKQVHKGRFELHAYCLLENHYHMLVEVHHGGLGDAMREICSPYVKMFNRAHDRDGPLFRSRYRAKHLKSEKYRRAVLCYIDDNPVQAGLARKSHEYMFGSANHFHSGVWPRWLSSDWVEDVIHEWTGVPDLVPGLYGGRIRHLYGHESRELVEARLASAAAIDESWTPVSSASVAAWLKKRALAADGDLDRVPMAAGTTVRRICAEERRREPVWTHGTRRGPRNLWPVVEAALLRRLSSCKLHEISRRMGLSRATVWRHCKLHDELVLADESYRRRATEIARQVLR